jgi:hypothetical protein
MNTWMMGQCVLPVIAQPALMGPFAIAPLLAMAAFTEMRMGLLRAVTRAGFLIAQAFAVLLGKPLTRMAGAVEKQLMHVESVVDLVLVGTGQV